MEDRTITYKGRVLRDFEPCEHPGCLSHVSHPCEGCGRVAGRSPKTENLISINEAASRGIDRVRKPVWAIPEDHLKIDIINGKLGPWVHLYSPFNKECNGRDPVDILFMDVDYEAAIFLPYNGPLPDSEEYKAKVALYDGALKR